MNNRISVATINSPQFVNLQPVDVNPLMSKCEIKVLYIGQNRNKSCITKEVATEMSKTLRGCPIVGYYMESKEDFGDHGDQVIIDGEGIKFKKLTKPYGFVSPDAKVWFQFFEDTDEFGNTCLREYLMTEGFLWTGQFEECQRVLENNNPQSMELDEKTLKGFWSTDNNKGVDFFIINDAIFSKLCILGEDVEPCFEGANISAPNLSSQFSMNEDFSNSLFSMMNELKYALNIKEGGITMPGIEKELDNVVENTTSEIENKVETTESVEFSENEANGVEAEVTEKVADVVTEEAPAVEAPAEEFVKKDDEEEKNEDEAASSENSDNSDDKEEEKEDDEEKKKAAAKCALEEELQTLKTAFEALKAENEELKEFKLNVENAQKDELINSFYMLSDEDKKDVIENKTSYSLDEIESKLSVICVRKKVSFTVDEPAKDVSTVYNLNSLQIDDAPEWVKAVRENSNR